MAGGGWEVNGWRDWRGFAESGEEHAGAADGEKEGPPEGIEGGFGGVLEDGFGGLSRIDITLGGQTRWKSGSGGGRPVPVRGGTLDAFDFGAVVDVAFVLIAVFDIRPPGQRGVRAELFLPETGSENGAGDGIPVAGDHSSLSGTPKPPCEKQAEHDEERAGETKEPSGSQGGAEDWGHIASTVGVPGRKSQDGMGRKLSDPKYWRRGQFSGGCVLCRGGSMK